MPAPIPEQRTCALCQRTIQIRPTQPGWTVVEHEGARVWACPDCARRLDAWGW